MALRAGVRAGALYHYFQGKRDLLLAMLDDLVERAQTAPAEGLALDTLLGDDPRAAIGRWLRGRYSFLRRCPRLVAVLLGLAEADPEIRWHTRHLENLAIVRLRSVIALGQRQGVFGVATRPPYGSRAPRGAGGPDHLLRDEVGEADSETSLLEELSQMICLYLLEEPRASDGQAPQARRSP